LALWITLASFNDGISNTMIFSEWLRGPGTGNSGQRDGLWIKYSGLTVTYAGQNNNHLLQAHTCRVNGYKGEIWIWSVHSPDYAQQPPNRRRCEYTDNSLDRIYGM